MHYSSSSAGEITAGVISHRHRVAPRAIAQLAQVPRIFTAQHTVLASSLQRGLMRLPPHF
jgi:hypothetical protein